MCDWLNLFYSYDTIAVDKVDECGLSNIACRTHLAKKTKIDAILAIEGEV